MRQLKITCNTCVIIILSNIKLFKQFRQNLRNKLYYFSSIANAIGRCRKVESNVQGLTKLYLHCVLEAAYLLYSHMSSLPIEWNSSQLLVVCSLTLQIPSFLDETCLCRFSDLSLITRLLAFIKACFQVFSSMFCIINSTVATLSSARSVSMSKSARETLGI